MTIGRLTIPIRRTERKEGEDQARRSQPGRYRRAWRTDVTSPPRGLRMPAFLSMDEVPPDLARRASEKMFWVRRFVDEGCPRGKLMEYAGLCAVAMNKTGDDIPPYTTLRDWAHLYAHWGLVGLVDKVRKDSGRSRTIPQNVRDIGLACLVGLRQGVSQALSFLARVRPDEPLPSYDALRNEIQRFKRRNPHLMSLVREGLTGWRSRFRLALPGIEFPAGFRVAVDSTVCDLWVRVRDFNKPSGWKAIRCVLTVVEDVGSRALLTFNLSTCDVDSGIALGTLRRAVVPGHNYPGLPTIGLPREVLVDKGPEHLASFAQAIRNAGAEVIYTSGTPEDNGRTERVIDTVKTEILSNLPGYSRVSRPFNAYRKRGSEDKKTLSRLKYEEPQRDLPLDMLLTLEELECRIHAWATLYNARPHTSLKANSQFLEEAMELDRLLDQEDAA